MAQESLFPSDLEESSDIEESLFSSVLEESSDLEEPLFPSDLEESLFPSVLDESSDLEESLFPSDLEEGSSVLEESSDLEESLFPSVLEESSDPEEPLFPSVLEEFSDPEEPLFPSVLEESSDPEEPLFPSVHEESLFPSVLEESSDIEESLFPSDLDFVDDLYFSALFDEEQEGEGGGGGNFEVSDAKYAEELQFQETLMGSVIISQMKNVGPSPMEGTSVVLPISDQPMSLEIIDLESGESSLSFCDICAERKENHQMFKTQSCAHSFCNDCISRHVAIKLQDSIRMVTCPGLNCRAVLELDACRPVLTRGVIDIWEEALCEEVINASQRFYCPFKDCSALLVDDNEGEAIRESECPFCHRLFCAQCYVPWHPGVECEEFMRLNEDERGREDLMVRELAKDKKWCRCPRCKFYVERTEGCPHMVCRCRFEFCYGCGEPWGQTHGGCTRQ